MPKKVNRQPVRNKARARHAPPRPRVTAERTVEAQVDESSVATAVPFPASDASVAPTASIRPPGPARSTNVMTARPASPARRTGPPPRRTAGLAFSYAYLRRDLLALAVLAPVMVVLVIVAYAVFH